MKTAISIPDALHERADALADRMKVSRSKLYCIALQAFLESNQQSEMTQAIDAFIDSHGQPVDPIFLRGSLDDLQKTPW